MFERDPLAFKVLLAFLTGGLVLFASAWFTLSAGERYLESDERVDRLTGARAAISRVLGTVKDAETGQRGFLITGKGEYLTPYHLAVAALDARLREARAALDALDQPTAALDEIEARAKSKFAEIENTIDVRQMRGFDAARQIVTTDAGKDDVDRIRLLVQRIVTALDAEQGMEVALARERHQSTVIGVWLLGTMTGLLFVASYLVIAWEISQRHVLATELEQIANHDPLTRIPNRRFFDEWLGYALAQARRDGTHIGLLFIDIDGFKAINDRHGHKVGDTVLTEIARRFKDVSRESDVLARFGGDEFVLAAPNTQDRHELVHVAQRLIASLSNPRLPPLSDIAVGASIGVAFFPDDATDLRGLVTIADEAMYSAKRSGKNRIKSRTAEVGIAA